MSLFSDRIDAGQKLAERLSKYSGNRDLLVLALPRGGVPVAFEVAKKLGAQLDVFIVRKLGVPGHEEFAMGAIASGGIRVLNMDVVRSLGISDDTIAAVAAAEQVELERREQLYRKGKEEPRIEGRTVILVDDGLATGATMNATVKAVRTQKPAHLIVAVPTAAKDTCEGFEEEVDEAICLTTPEPFYGVGAWYVDFSQTSDKEVCNLLEEAAGMNRKDED
ncbi:phosphoribosyltransferase [Methanolobus sp.]|uniref:phosphoribosyltransferase n=1 Tax=Methanolobus sp. TaxID=1874737 RepID=UPI0025F2BD88|nr:phosphoribosyltransferase [Methanolobus sp.]